MLFLGNYVVVQNKTSAYKLLKFIFNRGSCYKTFLVSFLAIFGSTIEETMAFERTRSKRKVPYIVENCVSFLIEKGLEIEGIFR